MAGWFGHQPEIVLESFDQWRQTVAPEHARATADHLRHSPLCSMEKVREQLGFSPEHSVEATVRTAVDRLVAEGTLTT